MNKETNQVETVELDLIPSNPVKFNDKKREVTLMNGEIIKDFHTSKKCHSEYCPVHNPSDHQYKDFELSYFDGVFTRITTKSKHGFVVDPDDPVLNIGGRVILRNSVFCNICETTIISTHLNDEQRCDCDMGTFVLVNGGKDNLKRVRSARANYEDTSIVFM